MAQIRPFCGILPREGLARQVAALPYDVYSREEAKREVAANPMSFLRVDRAETLLGDEVSIYAPEVYQKARETLWGMVADGTLVQDARPCYYLYELTMGGRTQTGLVACASVDDYLDGTIARHENTRADKEEDRIRHVEACDAQTGPIFLAYRGNDALRDSLSREKQGTPLFDFTAPDGVRHRGFRIQDTEKIARVTQAFAKIPRMYIADGHHRCASAAKVAIRRREAARRQGFAGSLESDFFLSVLFAQDELLILPYNRVVAGKNGSTDAALLQKIARVCEIRKNREMSHARAGSASGAQVRNAPFSPTEKGQVGMYVGGTWYALTFRDAFRVSHPVEGLDVSFLQREILGPILGIADPRTDARISFVGGIRGLGELCARADAQDGVAFAMYPTSMEELLDVADHGLLMPPKSTWFEPKLRSGLFLHAIANDGCT